MLRNIHDPRHQRMKSTHHKEYSGKSKAIEDSQHTQPTPASLSYVPEAHSQVLSGTSGISSQQQQYFPMSTMSMSMSNGSTSAKGPISEARPSSRPRSRNANALAGSSRGTPIQHRMASVPTQKHIQSTHTHAHTKGQGRVSSTIGAEMQHYRGRPIQNSQFVDEYQSQYLEEEDISSIAIQQQYQGQGQQSSSTGGPGMVMANQIRSSDRSLGAAIPEVISADSHHQINRMHSRLKEHDSILAFISRSIEQIRDTLQERERSKKEEVVAEEAKDPDKDRDSSKPHSDSYTDTDTKVNVQELLQLQTMSDSLMATLDSKTKDITNQIKSSSATTNKALRQATTSISALGKRIGKIESKKVGLEDSELVLVSEIRSVARKQEELATAVDQLRVKMQVEEKLQRHDADADTDTEFDIWENQDQHVQVPPSPSHTSSHTSTPENRVKKTTANDGTGAVMYEYIDSQSIVSTTLSSRGEGEGEGVSVCNFETGAVTLQQTQDKCQTDDDVSESHYTHTLRPTRSSKRKRITAPNINELNNDGGGEGGGEGRGEGKGEAEAEMVMWQISKEQRQIDRAARRAKRRRAIDGSE